MCEDTTYNYFPVQTIGGPSGDYFLMCPVKSCRWAEVCIETIAYIGTGQPATVATSYSAPPKTPDLTGTVVINGDAYLHGKVIGLQNNQQYFPPIIWNKLMNSDLKYFIRIDVPAGQAAFVGVKFRVKPIKIVPGPSTTVHPDHQHQMNIAREDTIRERLKKMGIPAYAQEGV